MASLVPDIFTTIGEAVTGGATALTSALSAITAMFYASGTGLTFLGTLSLIAVGMGLLYWGFGLVRGLISKKK